jgi:N-acetyl-anhydromuramyl-L-alanine amidase AmpD
MNGPNIRRLQEYLVTLGFNVGSHGTDGIFGRDTETAVRAFQEQQGLMVDGRVDSETTWPALMAAVEKVEENGTAARIIDRRRLHAPPTLYREEFSPRPWTGMGPHVISGVTLHQTGILLAERPQRWDNLNAHIGVLRDGSIILANPLESFIWHAQCLSATTIGIEFNGNFEGLEGRSDTLWSGGGGPHRLTPAQLRAADDLFAWLQQAFSDHGGSWNHVYAHRQSSADRRADPGYEIWQKIAMKWRARLSTPADDLCFHGGSGCTIPREWDPGASGSY